MPLHDDITNNDTRSDIDTTIRRTGSLHGAEAEN